MKKSDAPLISVVVPTYNYAHLLPRAPRWEPADLVEQGERYARTTGYPIQYQWNPLQGINDGGDVFFDFINERLRTSDTPDMVFEVLYFCLSDGFLGKFSSDIGKLDQYKSQLLEKIHLPELPAAIPAIKTYFKAYVTSNRVRDIIDSRQFSGLATSP